MPSDSLCSCDLLLTSQSIGDSSVYIRQDSLHYTAPGYTYMDGWYVNKAYPYSQNSLRFQINLTTLSLMYKMSHQVTMQAVARKLLGSSFMNLFNKITLINKMYWLFQAKL